MFALFSVDNSTSPESLPKPSGGSEIATPPSSEDPAENGSGPNEQGPLEGNGTSPNTPPESTPNTSKPNSPEGSAPNTPSVAQEEQIKAFKELEDRYSEQFKVAGITVNGADKPGVYSQ